MNIKNARTNIKVELNDLNKLLNRSTGVEIQEFNIALVNNFKCKFESKRNLLC